MVEVAVCYDDIVLLLAGRIERLVVVFFDRIVFDVFPEMDVAVLWEIALLACTHLKCCEHGPS